MQGSRFEFLSTDYVHGVRVHVSRAKHFFHFWIDDIRRIYLVTFPVILSIRHW